MTEAALLQALLLRSSELGARLFRNQVGRYQLADGRWLSSGLCVGSSDLIGWAPNGLFVAVEVKRPGRDTTTKKRKQSQGDFIAAVRQAGGIGGVVRSVADLEALLARGPTSCV